MTKTRYYIDCDRCKGGIAAGDHGDTYSNGYKTQGKIHFEEYAKEGSGYMRGDFDLCKPCSDDFKEWARLPKVKP